MNSPPPAIFRTELTEVEPEVEMSAHPPKATILLMSAVMAIYFGPIGWSETSERNWLFLTLARGGIFGVVMGPVLEPFCSVLQML